jgi:hypothetical protein
MKIIIPSYQRYNENLTIKALEKNNIPLSCIYLFVANETEKDLYLEKVSNEIHIIVGIVGLCNIRNFITDYFDEGEILICMDDDIKDFVIIEKPLLEVLNNSIEYLENSPYQLIGFPPTSNLFFNRLRGYTEGLFFCVGVFYILKNDKTMKVMNLLSDFQITLMSYEKYGKVIRCSDIMFKTKYWGKNGLEEERKALGYYQYYHNSIELQYKYSKYMIAKNKNVKIYDYPLPNFLLKENQTRQVIKLPSINPKLFEPILKIFETLAFKKNHAYIEGIQNQGNYRKNFGEHKSIVFGFIENRPAIMKKYNKEKYELSRHTKAKMYVWEELKKIGDIICPFQYSSCYINNNTVSGKHYDSNNVGLSCIVSIGDYEGCNLVISGKKYDAKYKPIIFDGSKIEHWNTDDLVGNKYSLIFYNIL